MSTQGNGSVDGNLLFDKIQADNRSAGTGGEESKLSGHRRDRYVGDDVAHLSGNASTNNVEAAPKEPFNSGKLGWDPKDGTASVRTGHLFRTVIPPDYRNTGKQYPIAVGFCARPGCTVHCNQNPLPRECSGNPSIKFANNQMSMTYTYTSPE